MPTDRAGECGGVREAPVSAADADASAGGRSGGGGGGGGGRFEQGEEPLGTVRETSGDASLAKLSAASKGYFHDPFIAHLFGYGTLEAAQRIELETVHQRARRSDVAASTSDSGLSSPPRSPSPAHHDAAHVHQQAPPSVGTTERLRRMDPMIMRGTYARVVAVRRLCEAFVRGCCGTARRDGSPDGRGRRRCCSARLVSLGGGFDTLPFVMLSAFPECQLEYVEVDVAETVHDKARRIRHSTELSRAVGYCRPESSSRTGRDRSGSGGNGGPLVLSTERYKLVCADLRDTRALHEALRAAGVVDGDDDDDDDRPAPPTLFLSECMLVYMKPSESDALLAYIQRRFGAHPCAFVCYDPTNPSDAFGHQMLRNLEERGAPLLGLEAYPTMQSNVARLKRSFGVADGDDAEDGCTGMNMLEVYQTLTSDAAEKRRVETLEWLDEMEEFVLMMRHYMLVWFWTRGAPPLHLRPCANADG